MPAFGKTVDSSCRLQHSSIVLKIRFPLQRVFILSCCFQKTSSNPGVLSYQALVLLKSGTFSSSSRMGSSPTGRSGFFSASFRIFAGGHAARQSDAENLGQVINPPRTGLLASLLPKWMHRSRSGSRSIHPSASSVTQALLDAPSCHSGKKSLYRTGWSDATSFPVLANFLMSSKGSL